MKSFFSNFVGLVFIGTTIFISGVSNAGLPEICLDATASVTNPELAERVAQKLKMRLQTSYSESDGFSTLSNRDDLKMRMGLVNMGVHVSFPEGDVVQVSFDTRYGEEAWQFFVYISAKMAEESSRQGYPLEVTDEARPRPYAINGTLPQYNSRVVTPSELQVMVNAPPIQGIATRVKRSANGKMTMGSFGPVGVFNTKTATLDMTISRYTRTMYSEQQETRFKREALYNILTDGSVFAGRRQVLKETVTTP